MGLSRRVLFSNRLHKLFPGEPGKTVFHFWGKIRFLFPLVDGSMKSATNKRELDVKSN